MKILQVMEIVKDFFYRNLTPVFKIVSVRAEESGWEVILEVIEEKEYMITYAKDELIGVYNVHLNQENEIVSFERSYLRARSDLLQQD